MKHITLFLLISVFTLPSWADNLLIFINSDDQQQQQQVNVFNYLLFEEKIRGYETVYIIDLAQEQRPFRGEAEYIHDDQGFYSAKYLPTQTPQVMVVGRQGVRQSYRLTDFLGHYLPPSAKEFP
ncbi:hypothetical protein ACGRPS_05730 [Vibrio furnissii]|uniref:hypothetical protein n=1 Tax=Vibrio furnissii TaxID=29494 RepID=UPI001C9D4BE0|nr:hypothetical protein [Vibrio fluvialis]HCG7256515.1 hypothetical protein [Vibrio parahaemolyticus]MBY8103817.1 hypothetical protein [Vibrio fluvialis]MBY8152096.1 hypothetical protein [Vibrio fluvialis]MBY8181147.1 hypothetical protein [Vibrio fluvialis]